VSETSFLLGAIMNPPVVSIAVDVDADRSARADNGRRADYVRIDRLL
jgi:hypothetical protein